MTPRAAALRHAAVHRGAIAALAGILSLASVATLEAQGRGRDNDRGRSAQGIPPGHLPPPGECRVWYDNRPPGQQPPPTSCGTARATAARDGGRVIYGDGARRGDRGADRRDDDRRRDRECDEKDRRKGECGDVRDRYPDRYPDRTYPRTLPDMLWGVAYTRGERPAEARQWIGGDDVQASYTDADRNGRPEVVTWTDGAGRIVQRWIDDNRDGRADRVALYENGRVARVLP